MCVTASCNSSENIEAVVSCFLDIKLTRCTIERSAAVSENIFCCNLDFKVEMQIDFQEQLAFTAARRGKIKVQYGGMQGYNDTNQLQSMI